MENKTIEELNELFANALALKILWAPKMQTLLVKWWIPQKKATDLIITYWNFLIWYEKALKK